jgi:hypothetical protein
MVATVHLPTYRKSTVTVEGFCVEPACLKSGVWPHVPEGEVFVPTLWVPVVTVLHDLVLVATAHTATLNGLLRLLTLWFAVEAVCFELGKRCACPQHT